MIGQALLLGAAVAGLAVGAAALAACLRLGSATSYILATYLVAWAAVTATTLALSPAHAVTRPATGAWVALFVIVSLAVWTIRGRPSPPLGGAPATVRKALRDPVVALTTLVAVVAGLYAVSLAVGTPENEGDALAYHVARAAFWYRHHGVAYIPNAVDGRLNDNPPFAEIGVLFSMLASGTQRFVGLVQMAALPACAVAAFGLARRIGADARGALFGATVFVGLPVVITQSWTAENDLVVASFLAACAYFTLSSGPRDPALAGLALSLAVGTKATAIFALPLLVALALLARSGRMLARAAWAAGLGAVGAVWYVVNAIETGTPTGGLTEGTTNPHTLASAAGTFQRFVFGFLDLSGSGSSNWRHVSYGAAVYRVVGLALIAAAGIRVARGARLGTQRTLVLAGLLVAAVPALISVGYAFLHAVAAPHGIELPPLANVDAGATPSWFGPAGVLAVTAGIYIAARRRGAPAVGGSVLLMAVAPLVSMALLAAAIAWDPYRGRFFILPVLLASATWSSFMPVRWLAWSVAMLGALTAGLSLGASTSKPTGIGVLQSERAPSIWGRPLWEAQTVLRPDSDETSILHEAQRLVPRDAGLALAPRPNDLIAPYFGQHLSRDVRLVLRGQSVPASSSWLVRAPHVDVRVCPADWRVRGLPQTPAGWLVAQRVSDTSCSRTVMLGKTSNKELR